MSIKILYIIYIQDIIYKIFMIIETMNYYLKNHILVSNSEILNIKFLKFAYNKNQVSQYLKKKY